MMYLCQCERCSATTTTHQTTGQTVPGLYVSRFTYNRHHAPSSQPGDNNPVSQSSFPTTANAPAGESLSAEASSPGPQEQGSDPEQLLDIHVQILDDLRSRMEGLRDVRRAFFDNPPPITFDRDAAPSDTPPILTFAANRRFLMHQKNVTDVLDFIDTIDSHDKQYIRDCRKAASTEMLDHLQVLDRLVAEAWQKHQIEHERRANLRAVHDHVNIIDCEPYFATAEKIKNLPAAFLASITTVVILHLIPGLAEEDSNFLLGALRIIITAACISYVRHCSGSPNSDSPSFPDPLTSINADQPWFADVRTAVKTLRLDPDLVSYACCRTCFSCYELVDGKYPARCTYRETGNSPECRTKISSIDEDGKSRPIQTYQYQPITSFIGRLLSRPGISEQMETVTSSWNSRLPRCWDIFGASLLQSFLGPDNREPFLKKPPKEERLIFSLFVDWFNPFGNKIAGKKRSVGGIYMVCLNLPIHLRYLPENVYVAGLIPGEPSTHHINHVFRPLISDLRNLWDPGVWFTKTAAYLTGCLVRVAVLPFIGDAPASRKGTGFAGVTAKFFCTLCKQTRNQLDNFDVGSWVSYDRKEHLEIAETWKNEVDYSIREKYWEIYQIRWSELLLLPYWDMTKFVIVDPMHVLFLNVVPHHIRVFLGQSETEIHGRKGVIPHTPEEQRKNIETSVLALQQKDLNKLKSLRRTYLNILASENSIKLTQEDSRSIPSLAEALIRWYSNLPDDYELKIPQALDTPAADIERARDPRHILDKAIIEQIRGDMARIVLPGWINRAPMNFASSSHGKLSADHWRTAVTINLVVTLIRIWGHPHASDKQRHLLENFITLVIAVVYASSRTVCEEYVQIVKSHLQRYYRTSVELFGVSKLVPSHHISLHLPQCLRLFGPVHGWWSYPYERYNGLIQRLNHNSRFTQMTTTFMRKFCQAANLKHLLGQDSLMDSIFHQIKMLFGKHYGSQVRGSLLYDVLSAQSSHDLPVSVPIIANNAKTSLGEESYQALAGRLNKESRPLIFSTTFANAAEPNHILLNKQVQIYPLIHAKGVVFADAVKSAGNSHIMFRPHASTLVRAGQIQKIFAHTRPTPNNDTITEFFFVVKEFAQLSPLEAAADPYRKYPLLDIKLYEKKLLPSSSIIKLADILSHFASCDFKPDLYDNLSFQSTGSHRLDANIDRLPGLDKRKKYHVVLSLDRDLLESRTPESART